VPGAGLLRPQPVGRPAHGCAGRLLAWLWLLALLAGAAGACRAGRATGGPLAVTAATGGAPGDARVRVTGLSGDELAALRAAGFDEARWQQLLDVRVAGNGLAAVAGRYIVTSDALEFQPALTFEAGRVYDVRFDPSRLPSPRTEAALATALTFGTPARAPAATVVAIYPSADVWPENMLRFYVRFSAPMSRGRGTTYVHLQDANGVEIPDAILAAYADLWNPDQTRLTVFFDPGRVKRGVGPNVAMGRAIVSGRGYRIAVDQAWPDVHGQPLKDGFTRSFTAGPAAYGALPTADWRLTTPKAGTRDALRVTFPAPLDRALLDRAIGVRAPDGREVAGTIAVAPGETTWTFAPNAAWSVGTYQLVALSLLEDPAGNKIGRAFETLPTDPAASARDAEAVALPFSVR
jgi:hypothetical protein